MNALKNSFRFTAIANDRSRITLSEGRHFRFYPAGRDRAFGEELSKRQIDLLRICMAVHVADSWAVRRRSMNRLRCIELEVEVLERDFWQRADSYEYLKECVDFLSGGDDWVFRFVGSEKTQHEPPKPLFRWHGLGDLVALYSGGLDSAAGLAIRIAQSKGRTVIPVTVRYQRQKGKLFRDHFNLLFQRGLMARGDLQPFQAGAFIRRKRIASEFGVELREVTHRCRPLLFMSLAGLVVDTVDASEVEVFESGVGSINLPLAPGPADYRTTRSTHPYFLRLIEKLVSHVCERNVRFVLPFADFTKGEMVKRVKALSLEELARKSVSCILHPLRRPSTKQCGHCAACVYRRQALISARVSEPYDAYDVDLFSLQGKPAPDHLRGIRAFHQQVGRLEEVMRGQMPFPFLTYLRATNAICSEEDLARIIELHRRYLHEWEPIIANARRLGLAWVAPVPSLPCLQGASA